MQTATDYSPATAIILWSERDFCIISDCRNSFNNKLKNLQTYEHAKNFFKPANTQFSSEESFKEKRHTFIGMCSLFTWFNMQIMNLCHR